MSANNFISPRDEELCALRDELQSARLTIEHLEAEVEDLYRAGSIATKENFEMRKRLQAAADLADDDIRLANLLRAEREALGL